MRAFLSEWPVDRPENWVWWVNQPEGEAELEALRRSLQRGEPFGGETWVAKAAKLLGLETTLRPRGRPKRRVEDR